MSKITNLLLTMALATFSASALAIPSTLTGNGIVWTFDGTIDSGDSSKGSFSLSADVSGSTLGASTYYLHEFSLKNFGSSASISNLVAPAGTWNWVNAGLNANGCKTNNTSDALCVFNSGAYYDAPSAAADFTFTFDISLTSGDLFPELAHFKVRWVEGISDTEFRKVGDLISDDFTWNCSGACINTVPEPGIVGLLTVGLLGMVAARRKLKL